MLLVNPAARELNVAKFLAYFWLTFGLLMSSLLIPIFTSDSPPTHKRGDFGWNLSALISSSSLGAILGNVGRAFREVRVRSKQLFSRDRRQAPCSSSR